MSVQVQLNGTMSLTDNLSGSIQLQKLVNLSFLGTVSQFGQQVSIGTSPTTITLPVSPSQFLYLKNLSTTATVTVTWTPNGGAQATILTLQPGAFILFLESNTTSGISTLSLTASVAATPVEFIIVG